MCRTDNACLIRQALFMKQALRLRLVIGSAPEKKTPARMRPKYEG
jgi:hypothetical protein